MSKSGARITDANAMQKTSPATAHGPAREMAIIYLCSQYDNMLQLMSVWRRAQQVPALTALLLIGSQHTDSALFMIHLSMLFG